MAHLITCPECDKQLQVPDDLLGTLVQCPACKHTFTAALPPVKPLPPPLVADEPARKGKARDDAEDIDVRKGTRSGSGPDRKPQKVQAIAVMSLVGGIFAILWALSWGGGTVGGCCLWPGIYYSLVLGIMAIVRASVLMGGKAYLEKPPTGLAVMHMINLINGDFVNLILGIVMMIFCNDKEVQEYMAK